MSERDDGGPAFSIAEIPGVSMGADGMSLRDYFAAHAPAIPEWFEHKPPARDFPKFPDWQELDPTHQQMAKNWLADPVFDLPEELAWFQAKVVKVNEARYAWNYSDKASRLFQWRYAFADAMLQERNRG